MHINDSFGFATARSDVIQWVDPVLGLRLRHRFTPNQEVFVRGDIGGFGISGSQFAWQAVGAYSYAWQFSGYQIAAVLGFRALGVNYRRGSGPDAFGIDEVFYGPIIGASSAFESAPPRAEGEAMTMLCHTLVRPVFACTVAILMTACTPHTTNTAQAPPPAPRPAVAIVAPRKPPPPLPEAVPPAPPAPDGHFVWNPGHYHWNYTAVDTGQRGFTWMPGNFVERPYPTSVWTNGNWALQDGSWGWTPGYWQ